MVKCKVRKRLGPAKFHMGAYLVIYSALRNKYEGLAAENRDCQRWEKEISDNLVHCMVGVI